MHNPLIGGLGLSEFGPVVSPTNPTDRRIFCLGLRSSEVDRLRARTAAKFVLRIEATGRCPTCGAPFPQPLLLALDEGYKGDGGRVVGLQILALRCARCTEES